MKNVKNLLTLLLIISAISLTTNSFAQTEKEVPLIVKQYRQSYSFISMSDSIYTSQSEFILPDGFSYPEPNKMTSFQNWISNFPLWHKYKPIGIWKGSKKYEYGEVARGVHLPWTGKIYTDLNFPIRFLGEFVLYKKNDLKFSFTPMKGDDLLYSDWLESIPKYSGQKEVMLVPDMKRDASETEFFKFMHFCMVNNHYFNLTRNCDSLSEAEVMPGDMFIARNKNGRKGRVLFIMNMIQNKKGNKLYTFATGCEDDACDMHIPLMNNDRNNPWVTLDQVKTYVEPFEQRGFYRFKLLSDFDN